MEKPALPTALHSCGARGCAKKRAGLSAPLPTSCLLVTPWQSTPGLGKLVAGTHKYVWVNFTPITWLISNAIVCLLLSPLLCFFFNFDLILLMMLVAMQGLQAQPPLHGCVQLGCSGHFAD